MNFLDKLKTNPKQIFLIDAFGALLTTFLLFGVLGQLESYFGMPSKVLYILSGTAFCLFMYSISCYRCIESNWKPFLGIVIVCNSMYVLGSLGLIIIHFEKLTELGFLYFILELIVIGTIVFVEYKSYLHQT